MSSIILVSVLVVAMDGILVWALTRAVGHTWKRYVVRWPPQPPGDGAVTKRFQSFRFGIVNASWSMHVTVDEQFLHFVPTRIMRWVGCRAISIPWQDIEIVSHLLGRWTTVRLADGSRIAGPRWCLELATTNAES